MEQDEDARQSFWTTVPGILTGIAALVTAVGGVIGVLIQAGAIGPWGPSSETSPSPTARVPSPMVPTPSPSQFDAAPRVEIFAPENDATFVAQRSSGGSYYHELQLRGSAVDPEDGPLAPGLVHWVSVADHDGDGVNEEIPLGNGTIRRGVRLFTPPCETTNHVITVNATDSLEQAAEATVTVFISHSCPSPSPSPPDISAR